VWRPSPLRGRFNLEYSATAWPIYLELRQSQEATRQLEANFTQTTRELNQSIQALQDLRRVDQFRAVDGGRPPQRPRDRRARAPEDRDNAQNDDRRWPDARDGNNLNQERAEPAVAVARPAAGENVNERFTRILAGRQ